MAHSEATAARELEALIRRGMSGETVDLAGALLPAVVVVASGGAVRPHFEGFIPLLYDRGGTPMLAAYTSLDRAKSAAPEAVFALTMTGGDLVVRMPEGHGIVMNPGHDVGFELFPDAVRAFARRARETGHAAGSSGA